LAAIVLMQMWKKVATTASSSFSLLYHICGLQSVLWVSSQPATAAAICGTDKPPNVELLRADFPATAVPATNFALNLTQSAHPSSSSFPPVFHVLPHCSDELLGTKLLWKLELTRQLRSQPASQLQLIGKQQTKECCVYRDSGDEKQRRTSAPCILKQTSPSFHRSIRSPWPAAAGEERNGREDAGGLMLMLPTKCSHHLWSLLASSHSWIGNGKVQNRTPRITAGWFDGMNMQ
jgi:hypothetical protein